MDLLLEEHEISRLCTLFGISPEWLRAETVAASRAIRDGCGELRGELSATMIFPELTPEQRAELEREIQALHRGGSPGKVEIMTEAEWMAKRRRG